MNRNLASNTGVVIGSVQAQHQQPSSLSSGSTVSSTQSSGQSSLDNLPRKFVSSMRTLFDIMDDKRTGFVRLVDIEARWQDDGSKGLPQGVIDCLRRVTPPSGMLSFERFCAGLKICLLRNQTADCRTSRCSSTDSNGNSMLTTNKNVTKALPKEPKTIRPPSAPLLDLDNSLSSSLTSATGHWSNVNGSIGISSNTATVRPNNALPVQRTLSLPKLSPSSDGESSSERFIVPSLYAPPKPPRTALLLNSSNNSGGGATNGTNGNGAVNRENFDKAEIRHALQNWQMNVLMNEMDAKDKRRTLNGVSHMSRGSADGSSASLLLQQQQQASQQLQDVQQMTLLEFQKKSTSSSSSHRRREPRRHTLQNGIDFNVLKRLRHLEEEKDLLLEGLNAVEKAQEWYFKQIALVQEKMKYLARGDTHYVSESLFVCFIFVRFE